MRKAKVFFNKKIFVGMLIENSREDYIFMYDSNYNGPPVSLIMPIKQKIYYFHKFPAYFEGVLPEGFQLAALLRQEKLDCNDYFGQLMCVGRDLVGAFTVEEERE